MKTMIRFVTLMLCIALLACGCGGKKDDPADETSGGSLGDLFTEPTETTEETEPAPVYEKQTVYLCTMQTQTLHENDAVSVRYNSYDEYGRMTESWVELPDGTKGTVTSYTYDESGNCILETYGASSRYERTYDEEGRILSQLYYYGDECSSEHHYTYNKDGYLIERTEITRYSEEKTYTYKVTYSPDYSSAVIDSYLDGEKIGHTEETYNADGQLTYYKNFASDGKWTSSSKIKYDGNGNKILEEREFSRDTQADYDVIYTYDENGLLISMDAAYYYGQIVEYTYEAFEILVRVN